MGAILLNFQLWPIRNWQGLIYHYVVHIGSHVWGGKGRGGERDEESGYEEAGEDELEFSKMK